jgi:hypothetical protein
VLQAIKPLCILLARLPVGPEHPEATAGANFQLPYRASFLLPHRRASWIRVAERLDDLADFAVDIHPPGGGETLAKVAEDLRRTASRLMAQVEPV